MDTTMTAQNKRSRTLMMIGAALLAVVVIIMLTTRNSQADAQKAQARAAAVEVTPAARGDIEELVAAVGSVEAMRDVMVSSETAGRITAVLADVGDAVKKGQTLVQVDAELKEVAVQQARAGLLAAKTNMEKAKKDFERTEKLYASGDVADIELEGYKLAYHAAEAQYQSAIAGNRLAERQLADTRIASPIAGQVASRRVEVGEMVGPGKEIANIIDIATVKVKLSIPEEDVVKLRIGQAADLQVDSRPGVTIRGKVHTIGAKSESPNGHTYPVEVLVQNQSGMPLRVGMFARVAIRANAIKNVIVVSREAIVEEHGTPAVFVARDGVAQLRTLTLGLSGSSHVQVVQGLNEGDLVVTFGHKALKDGTPIAYKGK
jgi:membrane fusion protein, multidrug efflux system